MGMTVIEKILARASGRDRVQAGDTVVCRVDMNVLIDLIFTQWPDLVKIADPDRTAIILDHTVPAPSLADANAGTAARRFAAEFGVGRFFDVGRHGICHQVIAENALALPGQVLTCTDSHTCAGGAYNAAARGLGPAEVIGILCTGQTWFTVGPTIRYELNGELPPGIGGKDVFLHIAGTHGDATIRREAAVRMGLATDVARADEQSPGLPMVGLVAPPAGYRTLSGTDAEEKDMDLRVRLIFMNRLHESIAGSGSICLAAASRVPGSIVAEIAEQRRPGELLAGHPSGVTPVKARTAPSGVGDGARDGVTFDVLGFSRTARRLMDGTAYYLSPDHISH